jgi:hypothetical protein
VNAEDGPRTLLPWWLGALVIFLVAVLTNLTFQERQYEKEIGGDVTAADRFIDISVRLHTVVSDPNGQILIEGKPPLRIVKTRELGGMLDTKARVLVPIDRALLSPREWFCSVEQDEILFGGAGKAPAQLVEGSEGSGKTTVLAQWHYIQWLSHLGEGREGLQTAPTNLRLGLVKREIGKLWRPEWYRYVTRKDFVGYELIDGSAIRMVSTHRQSEAGGSPIQGFNASWAGADEKQDQIEVHDDIEARGRDSRDGVFPQLATATVKDSTEYRKLKERITSGGAWRKRELLVCRSINGSLEFEMVSPFITRAFVEAKKLTLSVREFRRRFFAEDMPPELAVYYEWLRARNLRAIGSDARDVTSAILSPYGSYMSPGARFTLAAGHDPGAIFNTTEVARLLVIDAVPRWVVVGEFQTKQTTALEHARLFREYVCDTFDVERRLTGPDGNFFHDPESSKIATFVDPHGKGEAQTDYQTVYGAFQANGMDVFNPAPMTGRIKRSARIEMVNRLLGGTAAAPGVARILIAKAPNGDPAAPRLVEAFERLIKRPGDDNPEGARRKDEDDRTHAPAALGYLTWPFEQQALTQFTVAAAMDAARKLLV